MDGPSLKHPLPPYSTIGHKERVNILQSLKRPLSGYLGGIHTGGYWVEKLSAHWEHTFKVAHAIPCNSGTSGLLAACMAAGIKPGDEVWTTPYSMSATAACAKVLGAKLRFIDIETFRFSLDPKLLSIGFPPPKALIVTNLFGHPAYLSVLKLWCDDLRVTMIEDNAQSIYAKEGKHYAGTVGHIGVFSLNVHKHLQCGEGGVVVTNREDLSSRILGIINHGELKEGNPEHVGLNLRMTEPIAAIACAQIGRIEEIIRGRRRLAHTITDMMKVFPWLKPPVEDIDCKHSYYVWAGTIADPMKRKKLVHELNLRGFPIRAGYVKPLNYVFRVNDRCPATDRIDREIVLFEVCGYDPKSHHIRRMKDIVNYVAEGMNNGDRWKEDRSRTAAVCDR